MAEIPDIRNISEKWLRVTQQRSADYRNGIENPRRDWEASTRAAEENYNAGVQAAIARGAFGAGVVRAGSPKWKSRSLSLGVQRWPQGVTVARGDYEAGYAPFRDAIERLTLPPRGPTGSPQNIERVRAIAEALHTLKLTMTGG